MFLTTPLHVLPRKACTQRENSRFSTKVKVKVAQLCPTLCDPMDSTVHGNLQARILEWVAFLLPAMQETRV